MCYIVLLSNRHQKIIYEKDIKKNQSEENNAPETEHQS